jgi:putative spermidine/putrescine transport system substrate-binding protein
MGDIFFQIFLALFGIVVGILSQLAKKSTQRLMLLIFGLMLFLSAGLWWGYSLATKGMTPTQVSPVAANTPANNSANTLIAAAQQESSLNIIALARNSCNYGEVIDAFKSKYGITVNELNPTGGSIDEIQAIKDKQAGNNQQAPDVVDVGLGFAEDNKNLFLPYKVSNWDTIPDAAKNPDGYWYGDYFGTIVFLVNTDAQPKVPHDWNDLLDPAYKGQIAFGDPHGSNAAIMSVYASALANGGTLDNTLPGLAFFAKLNEIGNLAPLDSNKVMVATGETPIRITWDYLALESIDSYNGNPQAQIIVPRSGRLAGLYAQAISAYAAHPNAAKLWMEYLYSDDTQLLFMKGYCHPIREGELRARNIIPNELSTKIPDVFGTTFPNNGQLALATTYITSQWDSVVGDINIVP